MLKINLAENPATEERWVSVDDLPFDAHEELETRSQYLYRFWDEVVPARFTATRIFYEVALREIDHVEDKVAKRLAGQRLSARLVRTGRIIKVEPDDEADLPASWTGAMPDPSLEGTDAVTTS